MKALVGGGHADRVVDRQLAAPGWRRATTGRPRIDRRARFAEIPAAIAYLEHGRAGARAKVVVEVA
jgi:hypothetical protein